METATDRFVKELNRIAGLYMKIVVCQKRRELIERFQKACRTYQHERAAERTSAAGK